MLPDRDEIATVLVCEDDDPTRELLCSRLSLDLFRTVPAACAGDAMRRMRSEAMDMVLLDLALPDANGLDVLRTIRRADDRDPHCRPDLPVIVITGHGADEDRIRGLTEGADDYLVKPYAYGELLARMRNVLDRQRRPSRDRLEVGEIVVDRVRHAVTVGGRRCPLSRKEFELLEVLAADPERVLAKQDLLDRVWGYGAGERTRTLDAHASRLRLKLDPTHRRYVINVWSVGYKLIEGCS